MIDFTIHRFLDIERSDFSCQVFAVMDSDLSGHIDFYEFTVAMWNYCTLGEESLSLFAFDLYDKDCSGVIEAAEIGTMLRDLYGYAYNHNPHAVKLHAHLTQQRGLKFTPDSFRIFSKQNPSLFFPAFEIQFKMQTKVLGKSFWAHHAEKRVMYAPNHKVLTIRDVIGLHTDQHGLCDLVSSDGMLCGSPYVKDMVRGKEPLDLGKLFDCCDELDPMRKCVEMLEVTDTRNKRAEAALLHQQEASDDFAETTQAQDRINKMFRERERLKRFEIAPNVKQRKESFSTEGEDMASVSTMGTHLDTKRDQHRANVANWIEAFKLESDRNLLKEKVGQTSPSKYRDDRTYYLTNITDDITGFFNRHVTWKSRLEGDKKKEMDSQLLTQLREYHDKAMLDKPNTPPKKKRRFSLSSLGVSPPGVRYVSRKQEVKVVPVDALSWDSHPANPNPVNRETQSTASKTKMRRYSV
jgi:hypothetical protein